ncbi:MAG: tRNA (adenosine(37)-N6)-threonylcarbamoyltransferase complex dimerization subunit type 1 TsaB [Erysipelotrichaceae bacterium]|nr:tRNA (adenosine(37)-N6)-threonylcarbamoyltransferase complex dimerization subunit type 1 TsaB [Erysipelotrichaceae bacterium]
MNTLCLDTSHKYLVVGLLRNDQVIDGMMELCWKKQSELVLPVIDRLLNKHQMIPSDIKEIVISKGPGSFTGVRIAMTIAKVLGCTTDMKVYTISTLALYAGEADALVLLDARGGRCYVGDYNNFIGEETIQHIDQLNINQRLNKQIIGDGSLLGFKDDYPDIVRNFALTRPYWRLVDNIHTLKPSYLKESSEYQSHI